MGKQIKKIFFDSTTGGGRECGEMPVIAELKKFSQKAQTFDTFAKQINDIIEKFSGEKNIVTPDFSRINWPEAARKMTSSLVIYLRKIYVSLDPAKGPQYVIWLEILTGDDNKPEALIEKFCIPADIDRLFLKVWNTQNPIILNQLENKSP